MAKEIPLTQGKVALVDDDVYEWAKTMRWYAQRDNSTFYAVRREGARRLRLHREILHAPQGLEVDHINGDGLDNRRANLRLATRAQNAMNLSRHAKNKSGYKGVTWNKRGGNWRAQLRASGRKIHVGHFPTPEEAARAYDEAARKYHGEFARTNFGDIP